MHVVLGFTDTKMFIVLTFFLLNVTYGIILNHWDLTTSLNKNTYSYFTFGCGFGLHKMEMVEDL